METESAGIETSALKGSEKMRIIKVDKVTVNVGVGDNRDQLEKSKKIIENITGNKVVFTKAKIRQPKWGIRPGLEIGLKTTLRGKKADDFLKNAFYSINNALAKKCFDKFGNFGFGVKEHIELPNVRYDPALGIIGMDVLVSLTRPGRRVTVRKKAQTKIGKNQVLDKESAMEFIREKFNIKIE